MIDSLLYQVSKLKWLLIVYIIIAIALYLLFYFKANNFSWDNKYIKVFALLYNLSKRCLISFALVLGRIIYVIYVVVTGGSNDISQLAGFLLLTIVIIIFSGSKEEVFQLVTYIAIYILTLLEGLFIYYFSEMGSRITIVMVAYLFGVFAVLYTVYQSIIFTEKLFIISRRISQNKIQVE